MKRLFIIAFPLLVLTSFVLKPVSNYLNRQTPINPNTISPNYNSSALYGYFHGNKVPIPSDSKQSFLNTPADTNVLNSKSENNKEKRIEVDLAKQRLYAFKGDKKEHSFDVSTGKWNLTPTGEFRIWIKMEYALMTGGSKAINTYYYLPNVPSVMYFYNQDVPKYQGYGIHGAYWHDNFGHPMSHGCINMRIEDAKTLFNWSTAESGGNAGTKIIIYGNSPKE